MRVTGLHISLQCLLKIIVLENYVAKLAYWDRAEKYPEVNLASHLVSSLNLFFMIT